MFNNGPFELTTVKEFFKTDSRSLPIKVANQARKDRIMVEYVNRGGFAIRAYPKFYLAMYREQLATGAKFEDYSFILED